MLSDTKIDLRTMERMQRIVNDNIPVLGKIGDKMQTTSINVLLVRLLEEKIKKVN